MEATIQDLGLLGGNEGMEKTMEATIFDLGLRECTLAPKHNVIEVTYSLLNPKS